MYNIYTEFIHLSIVPGGSLAVFLSATASCDLWVQIYRWQRRFRTLKRSWWLMFAIYQWTNQFLFGEVKPSAKKLITYQVIICDPPASNKPKINKAWRSTTCGSSNLGFFDFLQHLFQRGSVRGFWKDLDLKDGLDSEAICWIEEKFGSVWNAKLWSKL